MNTKASAPGAWPFAVLLARHLARLNLDPASVAIDFARRSGVAEDARSLLRVLDGHLVTLHFLDGDEQRAAALAAACALDRTRFEQLRVAPLLVVDERLLPFGARLFLERQAAAADAAFTIVWTKHSRATVEALAAGGALLVASDDDLDEHFEWHYAQEARKHPRAELQPSAETPPRAWSLAGRPDLLGPPAFDPAPTHDEQGFALFTDSERERAGANDKKICEECVRYGNALFSVYGISPKMVNGSRGAWTQVPLWMSVADPESLARRIYDERTSSMWRHRGELWLYNRNEPAGWVPTAAEPVHRYEDALKLCIQEQLMGVNPFYLDEAWPTAIAQMLDRTGVALPGWADERHRPERDVLDDESFRRANARPAYASAQLHRLLDGLMESEGRLSPETLLRLRRLREGSSVSIGYAPVDDFVGAWGVEVRGERGVCHVRYWRFDKTAERPFIERAGGKGHYLDGGHRLVWLSDPAHR